MNLHDSFENNAMLLEVGDKVLWHRRWGMNCDEEATVSRIEIALPGEQYRVPVNRVDPIMADSGLVVVLLDNKHWVYGDWITPLMHGEAANHAELHVSPQPFTDPPGDSATTP